MIVSKKREGSPGTGQAGRPSEALNWLQRQLEWEAVLTRLRVAAGVLPARALESHAGAAVQVPAA